MTAEPEPTLSSDQAGSLLVHYDEGTRWAGGWHWRPPSRGEHFRRCSYCGSIHPEDLTGEEAWRAEWADAKYGWPHKFYVDIPNRDPGALFVISSSYGTDGVEPGPAPAGMVAWDTLTPEQLTIAERDGYLTRTRLPAYVGFGTRRVHHAKFYSVHLADPALSAEVRDAIQAGSGLRFRFSGDGRVGWSRYSDQT